MVEALPLNGWVVRPDRADRFLSPPVEAVADGSDTRPPDGLVAALFGAEPTGAMSEASLEAAAGTLRRLLTDDFERIPGPFLAVEQLTDDVHTQTGVVADLPVAAYRDGGLRPHEAVEPDRVEPIARFLEIVGHASAPVAVTHRVDAALAELVAAVTARPPRLATTAAGGVRHRLWLVDEPAARDRLAAALSATGPLTILDGHHRCAAAAAVAGRSDGTRARRLLAACFPHDELRIVAIDRIVAELPDGPKAVERLRATGVEPAPLDGPARPDAAGVVVAWLDGTWWRIELPGPAAGAAGIDAARLHRHVIDPLLGDESLGDEIAYLPAGPPGRLAERAGPDGAAFALHPVSADRLLAVADGGELMPPKSTYVVPKVSSGLVVVPR